MTIVFGWRCVYYHCNHCTGHGARVETSLMLGDPTGVSAEAALIMSLVLLSVFIIMQSMSLPEIYSWIFIPQ